MGGVRKPFLELEGEPVLLHALRPFLDHPSVEALAIALGPEDLAYPPDWLAGLDPRVTLVPGGGTRGESVMAAILALPENVELVAVHDAARPFVTGEILQRCIEASVEGRGAVAGWPAVDTLKEVEEGGERILGTLARNRVWHAQTPQVFPRELVLRAYGEAMDRGITDTDDAALVERIGGEVVMVPGSATNLKITRPEDLPLARAILTGGLV
jgi:2-C-methyl-D-erythritol 4-phosphate cytidylyltransferase